MNISYPALPIDNIRTRLIASNERLAVAESVTAGFLQAAFSTAQDASLFYEGGITAYNINQKTRHLAIDKKFAETCNCVSARTAEEMAIGVCRLFKCEWGVSVTGYASPVKESDLQLFAYFAVVHKDKVVTSRRIEASNLAPEEAQLHYVSKVLEIFNDLVA